MKSKYKIILVEDEESLRLIYSEYLTMQGLQVLSAADGQEALDLIEANPNTDLILLDVMLPKIDGLELLEKIKSDPKTKSIIVYMITVLGTDKSIKRAFELGADGYLIKDTMNPEQVKTEILAVLESKEK